MNFTFSPTDPCYRLTKRIMSFLGLPFRRNAGIWRVFCAQLLYRYEEIKMGIVHIKREVLFHTAHSINPWRGLRRRLLSWPPFPVWYLRFNPRFCLFGLPTSPPDTLA